MAVRVFPGGRFYSHRKRIFLMGTNGITLVGLGPGALGQLTLEAWQILQNASEIYLRTSRHPVVERLPNPGALHSFDELYLSAETLTQAHARIVERVLELGRRPEGVIYAVPGHPFVAEVTGVEIASRAREADIPLRVVEGISLLEPVFSALQIDPYPHTAFVDALELAQAHVPTFQPNFPAVIAQLYSTQLASQVKRTLLTLYPGEREVALVHQWDADGQRVERLPLSAIDQSEEIGTGTCLYLPALDHAAAFEAFLEVVAHLRAPEGCPWDREQTHKSLSQALIEEAYEALEAIERENPAAIQEELGDLLLVLMMHAQIASEAGDFNMSDVLRGIHTKIVRRHPHVFGDAAAGDAEAVLKTWERLKAEERAASGKGEASLLDGVALALPALIQAEEYQKRAARVGFDWPEIQGVREKLSEELSELDQARDLDERSSELGDLLFAVVNLARWYKVDPEAALRATNQKFRQRFSYIERSARAQGRSPADLSIEEMEALWQEAKKFDR